MAQPTTEKLALAMIEAGIAEDHYLVTEARAGRYDDYKSDLEPPIVTLVARLREHGYDELAKRAIAGEFDATRDESDDWMASPDGQAALAELPPAARAMFEGGPR